MAEKFATVVGLRNILLMAKCYCTPGLLKLDREDFVKSNLASFVLLTSIIFAIVRRID
jgi:hypothetical protein